MKKIIRRFAVALFIIGFIVFIYPYIYKFNKINTYKKEITNFNNLVTEKINSDKTTEFPYSDLYDEMKAYNDDLYLSGQTGLSDMLTFNDPVFFLKDYGIEEVFGYIEIEALNIKLPIYNGASDLNLTKGATYLAYTSLPIGGINTNTVIAAHNSYKGVNMFRYLYELNIGDDVYLTNFWETLHYKVIDYKIIEPDDIEKIYIQDGKDLLTLSTCYPYPTRKQRYLVYCEHCLD